jgi:hypothetical protein
MGWIPQLVVLVVIIAAWVHLFRRRSRERAINAPTRGQIKSQVLFETSLHRASVRGTGGFGCIRGFWVRCEGQSG